MDYGVLGPVELACCGQRLRLRRSARLLLAVLLLQTNRAVSRDRLVEELWGEQPPRSRHALDMQISRLRTVLRVSGDQPLVTLPQGYLLRVRPGELDVDRFEQLAARGRAELRAGTPAAAADTLREALRLWRGRAYEDLDYETPFQAEIERLNEQWLAALEARIDADLALGRHTEAIAELQALLTSHPHREGLCAQLMLALYRAGRQAESLHAYHCYRSDLLDQLGIEPGRALRHLQQSILQQAPDLDPPSPVKTARPRAQTLCRKQHSRLRWACCEHSLRPSPPQR